MVAGRAAHLFERFRHFFFERLELVEVFDVAHEQVLDGREAIVVARLIRSIRRASYARDAVADVAVRVVVTGEHAPDGHEAVAAPAVVLQRRADVLTAVVEPQRSGGRIARADGAARRCRSGVHEAIVSLLASRAGGTVAAVSGCWIRVAVSARLVVHGRGEGLAQFRMLDGRRRRLAALIALPVGRTRQLFALECVAEQRIRSGGEGVAAGFERGDGRQGRQSGQRWHCGEFQGELDVAGRQEWIVSVAEELTAASASVAFRIHLTPRAAKVVVVVKVVMMLPAGQAIVGSKQERSRMDVLSAGRIG